ncbi:MAG: ABC transporter ATP-binding protein [Enterococcus sp.]
MEAIRFDKITRSFKDGDTTIQALKETTFSIQKGEFVAVIGPSGSGKSTFLTIAGGLQTPSSGEVFLNEQPFSNLNEKKRAATRFQSIGFILQASNLVPFLTVEQQLQLVHNVKHEKTAKDAIHTSLAQLGIDKLSKKYPDELSGGERQRAAIARALYNDPAIILADEPTASLDSERAFEVVDILAKESKEKNKAIVMVTHDQRLIKKCDRIFEMIDGQLTERK